MKTYYPIKNVEELENLVQGSDLTKLKITTIFKNWIDIEDDVKEQVFTKTDIQLTPHGASYSYDYSNYIELDQYTDELETPITEITFVIVRA